MVEGTLVIGRGLTRCGWNERPQMVAKGGDRKRADEKAGGSCCGSREGAVVDDILVAGLGGHGLRRPAFANHHNITQRYGSYVFPLLSLFHATSPLFFSIHLTAIPGLCRLVFREPSATVTPQRSQMDQLEIERKDESSRSQFQRAKANSEPVSTPELSAWSPSCLELHVVVIFL
ncbi:hypothetical protein DKX38_018484 [Salix brachista]|uniref:Uncharacterized protein n=1 Tax=Salix brachista TaxID=2182728 RepID=A0A5N5KN45_9ROSI|nr:hypothetical protein DKX38_018484 [Salix brachista]